LVDRILELWADRWKSPDAIAEARRLARAAPIQHKLAYATYFNEVGSPEDAAALVGDSPQLPVSLTNLSINSVIATLLAERGDHAEAERVFNAILAKEPDHIYALRGRINLEITTGKPKAAVVDGQRLVSVMPDSARDRLLLARAYAAAGDARQADRTLWDAFHELPGNFEAYEALRAHVQKAGDPETLRSLEDEFREQRDIDLAREFI
jgi:tetratricopeptide (TPR) repeat protein